MAGWSLIFVNTQVYAFPLVEEKMVFIVLDYAIKTLIDIYVYLCLH